jgi:hypothetical protein
VHPINAANASEVARTLKETPLVSPGTVRRSASITSLAAAMLRVQAEIEDPAKNKRADAGKRGSYRYADLPAVLDVVRPALTAHDLAVMQFPCEHDGQPALTTLLMHASGEWVETTIKLRPVQTDPQSVGSALTYARRYALLALCGIAADDDDDGRAGSQRPQQQPKPAQQPQPGAARAGEQPTEYARGIVDRLDAARSRAEGGPVWQQFDADVKAGKVSAADKAAIDSAFRLFGQRFPAAPTA